MRKFTKYGTFMNNTIEKLGRYMIKNPVLYFILNCTWGSLLTVMGLFVTLIFLPFSDFKIHKYNNIYYLKTCFTGGWGFEMGLMFVTSKDGDVESLRKHEYGHTVQNAILGPFQLILVSIPSFLRFWYREFRNLINKPCTNSYDDIWFEHNATRLGTIYNIETGKYSIKNVNEKDK